MRSYEFEVIGTVIPSITTGADAATADIEIVELFTESLGEGGTGAETYIGLIRTDAELIADALA